MPVGGDSDVHKESEWPLPCEPLPLEPDGKGTASSVPIEAPEGWALAPAAEASKAREQTPPLLYATKVRRRDANLRDPQSDQHSRIAKIIRKGKSP